MPKYITHSFGYSYYAVTVYAVLKALAVTSLTGDNVCVSLFQIKYLLGYSSSNSRRLDSSIQCGIDELISNNVITLVDEYKKNYIFDCSSLMADTDEGDFTIITYCEFQKIFTVKDTNNFLLLRYFIILMSTISSSITVKLHDMESRNQVVGNFSMDYISNISGIGIRTVIEYNKILESIKLIYIHRQNDFVIDENNKVKQLRNVYGRYKDKEFIDRFAENEQKDKNSYRYTQKNIGEVNNNRRLAQMYNYIVKYGVGKYSEKELEDVYRYVIKENKKYESLYEKTQYDKYLDKIRSTDIFKECAFYSI